MKTQPTAWIFDIQGHAVHDGPGCRTLVFLSGCPLRCRWCANPEGQHVRPRLMYSAARCASHCLRCLESCPKDAIRHRPEQESVASETLTGQATHGDPDPRYPGDLTTPESPVAPRLVFDRSLCTDCDTFACIKACYHQALRLCGRRITLAELMRILQRDRTYWGAEGGVTFSGGEPLLQSDFLLAALQRCRQSWMHTALETCAAVPLADLLAALEYLDWLLVDLKHMDPEKHRLGTGLDNRRILENIRAVARSGWKGRLVVRLPLVPGFNDEPSNLSATLGFMREIGLAELEILPLHRLGGSKYEQLGIPDPFQDQRPPTLEQVEEVRGFFIVAGIDCYFGGYRPW